MNRRQHTGRHGAFAVLLLLLSACAHVDSESTEAAATTRFSLDGPHWDELDPDLKKRFGAEHQAAGTKDRPVFERHLPGIGPVALLGYLEESYPACHAHAHSLGKELYAQSQDLMLALQICGTRCTGACMHGVVGEALGEGLHSDIGERMEGFCSSEAMAAHKRGNCAHAIGHALLLNGRDLGRALSGCRNFELPAMRYYCATGVYMQYRDWLKEGEIPNRRPTVLYPCDEYELYPAACFRYMMSFIPKASGYTGYDIIKTCSALAAPQRRGCFHGLGFAYLGVIMERVEDDPEVLAALCEHGTLADQTLCVEGVIEKLADYDEAMAHLSCDGVSSELTLTCHDAAGIT